MQNIWLIKIVRKLVHVPYHNYYLLFIACKEHIVLSNRIQNELFVERYMLKWLEKKTHIKYTNKLQVFMYMKILLAICPTWSSVFNVNWNHIEHYLYSLAIKLTAANGWLRAASLMLLKGDSNITPCGSTP